MDIQKIEEDLLGTCQTVEEVTDEDPERVLYLIGQRGKIERCEQCSWWCETGEMEEKDNGYMCQDCLRD